MSILVIVDWLLKYCIYNFVQKPQWSLMVDQELLDAKLQIENAPVNINDRTLYPPLYRNVSRFKR